MRLISFAVENTEQYGVVQGEGVVSLSSRLGAHAPTLRDLLAGDGLEKAAAAARGAAVDYALTDIVYRPVIPNPDKIICVGLNYRDHIQETGRAVTEKPLLFSRFSASQTGHLQSLIRPRVSAELDFEGELAVVIGKPGRHIDAASALEHIAGYACYNDGSIRDWQRHTSQFMAGKTFASTGGFGPWLVTRDEIPDPARLTLETRLNGTVVQHTTTDLMIQPIPALLAYVSTILPLLPGDVLVTGTCGGVGAKRTPPLWMKPGDVVEVEISGVGCLRNFVADE